MIARIINVRVYCPDRFNFDIKDSRDNILASGEQTYIPDWFIGNSDSELDLEIDLETGVILNWVTPTSEEIQNTIVEYSV
jgi:hypothetical protein